MPTAAHDIYLFECSPFNPATGSTTTVRYATDEWITEPADTPANATYLPGMSFEGFGSSIVDEAAGMLGGLVEQDAGRVSLPISGGSETVSPAVDALLGYAWMGYPFTIYKVAAGATHSGKTTHLTGFVTGCAASEAQVAITITSKNSTLAEKPIQPAKFWGRKHALRFVTGSADRVNLDNNHVFTSSFTIEALLKPLSTPSYEQFVVDKLTSGNGYTFKFTSDGEPYFGIANASTTASVTVDADAGLPSSSEFQMYSCVFDTTANTLTVYRNGVQVGQTTGVTIDPGSTSNNLRFGNNAGTSTAVFNGDIAEVRLWNLARTADEIAENLYLNATGVPYGLVCWCKFGEGTGSTLGDSSESGINGTITNATWRGTYEGEATLAGVDKPWAIGVCKHREPVLIDSSKLIYSLCSRGFGNDEVGSFPAGQPKVYDGGNEISLDSSSGSGAAPLVYYVKNATASSSSHGKMETGSAPSAATTGTGWEFGTTSPDNYSLMLWGTERAAATFGGTAQPAGAPTTNDCIRSESTVSGRFNAGTWTVDLWIQGNTSWSLPSGGGTRIRVWRSANADGSSATEITSGAVSGGAITPDNRGEKLCRHEFTGSQFDVTSEYIFIQVAWHCLNGGDNATDDALIRVGNSKITTSPFNSSTSTPETDLWLATIDSGKFKFDAALGLIRLATAPTLRPSATFCAAEYSGDGTSSFKGQCRAIIEGSAGFSAGDLSLTTGDFQVNEQHLESGVHLPSGGATCLEVLRRVVHNHRASAGFQDDGIFRARPYWRTIYSGASTDYEYTTDDIAANSFEVTRVLAPIREIAVLYAPYRPAFSPAEIAGAVSQSERFDLQREFRRLFKSRGRDRTGNAWSGYKEEARKIVVETDFADEWMVVEPIASTLALFSSKLKVVRFRLERGTTSKKPTIGDVVKITYPRFGFDSGVKCIAAGVTESQPGDGIYVVAVEAEGLLA